MTHRPSFDMVSGAERRRAELFWADLVGHTAYRRLQAGRSAAEAIAIEAAPTPFQVRLADPSVVTPQARESKYRWAGDRVQIDRKTGGAEAARQVSSNGLFEVPSGGATEATVGIVYRGGTHRSMVRWRVVSGGPPAVLRPGVPHTVEISTRLRLSLWTFVPPFTKKATQDDVELDDAQVQLLKDADVDDVSLVWTIGWDKRDRSTDPAKPPKWHNGFTPRGQTSERHRVNYLKGLIAALHPKVQVVAGYELVRATGATDAALKAIADDFADWLAKATADDIRKYAQSINRFFESRGLDVDGIGYDFEFDQLGTRHRANLARLYLETSRAIGHHNGLVSYANAPFKEDGVSPYGFMQVQPFALASSFYNLLARPMCFDSANSTSLADIKESIACALRDPADTTKRGGAGLHPSQVQFGIWADKVPGGLDDLCRKVLRPNRIGLMVYNLPPVDPGASAMLRRCKTWNSLLNPGEGPAGQEAQPLQVPRGFGGWPPPFRATPPPRQP